MEVVLAPCTAVPVQPVPLPLEAMATGPFDANEVVGRAFTAGMVSVVVWVQPFFRAGDNLAVALSPQLSELPAPAVTVTAAAEATSELRAMSPPAASDAASADLMTVLNIRIGSP